MSTGDSISRTALDKPLHLLTEDDISQLTREDCRRYLKEKGMRRPSWNKSQAIQQVISLKALLEPTPEDIDVAVVARNKFCFQPAAAANPVAVTSAATERREANEFQISISVEESAAPIQPQHSFREEERGYVKEQPAAGAELADATPRVKRDSNLSVAQLTIFYSGKVNVYDEVSYDKARTLLQLAATPLNLPQDTWLDGNSVSQPYVSLSQSMTTKASPNYLTPFFPLVQPVKTTDNCQLQKQESNISREDNQEGATSRKASVQKYLEKRKDRSRFKKKVGTSSPTSLAICINQRMVEHVQNERPGHNDAYCSATTLPSLPYLPSRLNLAGNTIRDLNLSANNTDADEL